MFGYDDDEPDYDPADEEEKREEINRYYDELDRLEAEDAKNYKTKSDA